MPHWTSRDMSRILPVPFDSHPSYVTGFNVELFRPLLLDVWREACRHIEIQEATSNISSVISSATIGLN